MLFVNPTEGGCASGQSRHVGHPKLGNERAACQLAVNLLLQETPLWDEISMDGPKANAPQAPALRIMA
jgi:hypothetical protein